MNDQHRRDWSQIIIPNNLSYLPIVLGYVRGIADYFNFSKADIQKIELAVEEAVANVIQNSFLPEEDATFEIGCRRIAEGLEITIHDKGLPCDPSQQDEFKPKNDMEDMSHEGLGSFLIKELMDEFEFSNLGFKGKETRFVKYFDSTCIIDGLADHAPEVSKPNEDKTAPQDLINFTIRKMKPEEAVEVSRCVYDSYGYSYANEHIYYPERVAAMNKNGDLRSLVAVTDSGEVGGHFALIFHKGLPAEIGIAVTKKKFRGQKIAGKLGAALDEEARAMKLKGLQVREVTVHPYTQKFCQKLGYTDCGFLLAHSPTTMSFKGIADELAQRNTDIVGFKYFDKPGERTVYVPQQHRQFIEKLYDDLKVPVTFAEPPEIDLSETKTEADITANSVRSVCEIHIPCYGGDIISVLKQELSTMRLNEIKVAEMYLNLMDPATPYVVEEAEKLGFFFTGILPETKGHDSLIMQYLNGIQMDYAGPTIISDTAQELLSYIKSNDPHHK